jgi:hypothetical protein
MCSTPIEPNNGRTEKGLKRRRRKTKRKKKDGKGDGKIEIPNGHSSVQERRRISVGSSVDEATS